jgi:hypothetical protein
MFDGWTACVRVLSARLRVACPFDKAVFGVAEIARPLPRTERLQWASRHGDRSPAAALRPASACRGAHAAI